jgi:hypothetical protein
MEGKRLYYFRLDILFSAQRIINQYIFISFAEDQSSSSNQRKKNPVQDLISNLISKVKVNTIY